MTTKLEHIIEHNSSDYRILEAAPTTLPARVNAELLKQHDAKPLFVDLKIGKVGAQSRNLNYTSGTPRKYGREAWQSIVTAINERGGGVVGLLGHPDSYSRTGFEGAVAVYWLQAKIEADQTVTATAYFPPGPARDHVITSNALGMPIATSLYAKARETESGEIVDVELEQLDMVLHKTAGLLDAVDSNFTLHTETKADGTVVLHVPASQRHLIEKLLKPSDNIREIQQINQRIKALDASIKENWGTYNPIGWFDGRDQEKFDRDWKERQQLELQLKQLRGETSVRIPGEWGVSETRNNNDDNNNPTVIIPGGYF